MAYEVIEADLDKNKKDIINLLTENLPGNNDFEKRFSWIYENNPYGPPKSWLLRQKDKDEFVGCASLFPRRVYVNGKPIMAGIVGDTMMNMEHRTLGPALMLQRPIISLCKNSTFPVIYGFPNEFSEPVNIRSGYKIIGKSVRMIRIIRSKKTLKKFTNNFIANLLSPAADLFLKLNTFSLKRSRELKRISYGIVDSFDERFDLLWEEFIKPNAIIGEKTTKFLNWRYKSHPFKQFKIFIIQNENDSLLGYMVYTVINDEIIIEDILSLNNYDLILNIFVKECIKFENVSQLTIRLLENSVIYRAFKRNLFIDRLDIFNIVSYFNGKDNLNLLKDAINWHIVYGDSDE